MHALFCISAIPSDSNPRRDTLEALLPKISKALDRKGMTTMKQWQKYIKEHPDGYGLTQFRIFVQRYRMINNPSMRMEHKAGDKMFVYYTGDRLWIYPHKEVPRQVEVFVAILGYSLLTYVEAVAGQTKEYFISACENAFYFYGGVPQAVIPDNLKAAITKASRVESTLNEEFERFAEYYAITVFPARVRKPRLRMPLN